jgi:hypothetical protein
VIVERNFPAHLTPATKGLPHPKGSPQPLGWGGVGGVFESIFKDFEKIPFFETFDKTRKQFYQTGSMALSFVSKQKSFRERNKTLFLPDRTG